MVLNGGLVLLTKYCIISAYSSKTIRVESQRTREMLRSAVNRAPLASIPTKWVGEEDDVDDDNVGDAGDDGCVDESNAELISSRSRPKISDVIAGPDRGIPPPSEADKPPARIDTTVDIETADVSKLLVHEPAAGTNDDTSMRRIAIQCIDDDDDEDDDDDDIDAEEGEYVLVQSPKATQTFPAAGVSSSSTTGVNRSTSVEDSTLVQPVGKTDEAPTVGELSRIPIAEVDDDDDDDKPQQMAVHRTKNSAKTLISGPSKSSVSPKSSKASSTT
jgi:hypothetical protein